MRINMLVIALVAMAFVVIDAPAPNAEASTGDVRQNFSAPNGFGSGLPSGTGITFDGDNLWWTGRNCSGFPCTPTEDSRIYKLDASGNLVATIQTSPATVIRALAWDGQNLWGRLRGATGDDFYTIDRATGAVNLQFTQNIDGPSAVCNLTNLGGLSYDFNTQAFWAVGDNGRTVYNLSATNGAVLRSFDVPSNLCVESISTGGDDLWLSLYTSGFNSRTFQQYSFDGTPLGGAFTPSGTLGRVYVDGEFDPVSFAPSCVMWATSVWEGNIFNQIGSRIVAFEVPCSVSDYDESHYGSASSSGPEFTPDPVNPLFGNFVQQNTDISIPTVGPALEFSRSYNSSAAGIDGPLGFGWTHNYNMRLDLSILNEVTVYNSDGRQDMYVSLGGGQYLSPADIFDTLTESAGTYTLLTTDQTTFTFDSTGKLTSIADRNGNTLTLEYFSSGPDTGKLRYVYEPGTDPGRRKLTFAYSGGRISSIADPLPGLDARTVNFTYDGAGNLQTVESLHPAASAGATTTFGYDSNHLLSTVTDPNGNLTAKNCYDPLGRVYKQFGASASTPPVEPACSLARADPSVAQYGIPITELFYNTPTNAGATIVRDPRGYDTTYTFDQFFRVTQIKDALNGTVTRQYDANSNMTCETDQRGNKTAYTYDSRGNVLTMIDADNTNSSCQLKSGGVQWTYTYDPSTNEVLTATDPLDHQTESQYDSNGNLTRTINRETAANLRAIVKLTCYERDATTGQVLAIVESTNLYLPASSTDSCSQSPGAGNRTLFGYDGKGNQTCVADARFTGSTAACAAVTPHRTLNYDDAGRLLSSTDELSQVTQWEYDPADRLVKLTNGEGDVTTWDYDPKGNLVSITDANRQPVGTGPVSEADPLVLGCGPGTGNGVNDDPLDDGVADDGCPNTVYTYDNADRLIDVLDANIVSGSGHHTAYQYDLNGNLTGVVDANHQVTMTTPETGTQCVPGGGFNVDDDGDGVTDDGCPTTIYKYDALNRRTWAENEGHRIWQYAYDAGSNLIQRTTANSRVTKYFPDKLNRLSRLEYWFGSTYYGSVDYTYDAASNRKTMVDTPQPLSTWMAPGTWTYNYDALNRMTSVTSPGPKTVSYTYDDLPGGLTADYPGQRTKITYPDGKNVSYTYYEDGRMSTVTDWLTNQTTYNYDDAGRLDTAQLPNGVTTSYGYDDADRLNSVANGSVSSFSYTLDGVGNRRSVTDAAGTTNYSYDGLYRLTGVDNPSGPDDTYTYDATGNRLTKNATSYTYYAGGSELAGVGGAFYWEDYDGNVIIKDGTQSFSYDFEGHIISSNFGFTASYDGDGLRMTTSVPPHSSNLVNYTWDPNSPLPVIIQDTNNTYVYGLDLISATDNSGNTTFLTSDGLGSTTDLTNSSGGVTDTYTYDAFGAATHTGSSPNYWQFTGEQTDASSGMQYLRARYYDPAIGRFMTRDPFPAQRTNPQTWNQFAYAGNNPTSRVDPTGMRESELIGPLTMDISGLPIDEVGEVLRARSCAEAYMDIFMSVIFVVLGTGMFAAAPGAPTMFLGGGALAVAAVLFTRGYLGLVNNNCVSLQ